MTLDGFKVALILLFAAAAAAAAVASTSAAAAATAAAALALASVLERMRGMLASWQNFAVTLLIEFNF